MYKLPFYYVITIIRNNKAKMADQGTENLCPEVVFNDVKEQILTETSSLLAGSD